MRVYGVLIAILIAVALAGPLTDKAKELREPLNQFHRTWNMMLSEHKRLGLEDMSVECALCGMVVNEIEGLLLENATQQAIEKALREGICSKLDIASKYFCDQAVTFLPAVIEALEAKYTVSGVCMVVGLCEKSFPHHDDPTDVPTNVIDLDLPPEERFKEVCKNPTYQSLAQFLVNTVSSILPDGGKTIAYIGEKLNDMYFPTEYAGEIRGCAASIGVPAGWIALFNIGYELSDACTSIVAEAEDGTIYHGRNLDFWAGMGFTNSLKKMTFMADFRRNNKTAFYATTFAGYSGCLSCQRPEKFSVTVNTRFYPEGIGEFFYEIVAAIEEKNASLTTFLVRNVIQNEDNYDSGLKGLQSGTLIDDVYYIIAGVKSGEGAVISRNRTGPADTWTLRNDPSWYLIQTNYDHWTQPPWFDDRVHPAIRNMNAMGQSGLSVDNMLGVLSQKPTLNLQTTYTVVSIPKQGLWKSWARWCPFPCVE